MAAIEFTYRKVKNGIKCTGKVTMSCDHKLIEYVTGRTEQTSRDACQRLLTSRMAAHARDCNKG